MKEILKQAAKATKASQSQPKQAKASKRKQKQAIEPARAWVQNGFRCNKEHQPKSCEDLPKTPQQPRIFHKGPESPRMLAILPKPSQNRSQNFPKIDISCYSFLLFLHFYFALIFCWLFVDFKSFETSKIVPPCRREHYFYKIDVFVLSRKFDRKTIEIWIQKLKKNWTKSLKKRVWKHVAF